MEEKMKHLNQLGTLIIVLLLTVLVVSPIFSHAEEKIRYSCSNQIYQAFDKEKIEAFQAQKDVKVEVNRLSSGSAVNRLMNNFSDIASTARKLDSRHVKSDYVQTPLCRDPLAIISRAECGVGSITAAQLQDIFAGRVANWKEVGGADLPILVVVPGMETAAYKNFTRQVMQRHKIDYDFMAYDSTMAIEAVTHFPCGTVSFIARGAVIDRPKIQTIKIDGKLPSDKDYPYFQEFYYVTKGQPQGAVKDFIDFSFSKEGQKIMKKKGLIPIEK
jgi:phosphate transport system substrate-binding protein